MFHDRIVSNSGPAYAKIIAHKLNKLVKTDLESEVPLVHLARNESGQAIISLLCTEREDLFPFFFHMVSHWAVPGRHLAIAHSSAFSFRIKGLRGTWSLLELAASEENLEENFQLLAEELRLGAASRYLAERILETKGAPGQIKIAQVQYHIQRLASRLGEGLFREMQRLLASISETNLNARDLARLVALQYLQLRNGALSVRRLGSGLAVAVPLKEGQVFGEAHLRRAIGGPSRQCIARSSGQMQLFYIETSVELTHNAISMHIERPMHRLRMVRNEEEVMRNIVTLSGELNFARDIPQAMIHFDYASDEQLCFTIVLLRVRKPGTVGVPELLSSANFISESVAVVGRVRNRYPKEASLFRLFLPQERFFRADRSIDLSRARQAAAAELYRAIGEFRDYNGGMLSQQQQQLARLRIALGDQPMVENFFGSIQPAVMRSVMSVASLCRLYKLFDGKARLKVREEVDCLYVVTNEIDFPRGFPDGSLAMVRMGGRVGFLLRSEDRELRRRLLAEVAGERTISEQAI